MEDHVATTSIANETIVQPPLTKKAKFFDFMSQRAVSASASRASQSNPEQFPANIKRRFFDLHCSDADAWQYSTTVNC